MVVFMSADKSSSGKSVFQLKIYVNFKISYLYIIYRQGKAIKTTNIL